MVGHELKARMRVKGKVKTKSQCGLKVIALPAPERTEAVSPHSSCLPLPLPGAPSVGSVRPRADAAGCPEIVSDASPPAANPERRRKNKGKINILY